MSNQNNTELVNITQTGVYRLRLVRPKSDEQWNKRFYINKNNYAACRLFFMGENNLCLTKNYSAQYGKGLAILVGRMTGKFSPEVSPQISVEQLKKYVEPAFGAIAEFDVEVTQDGEYNGRLQYKYIFKTIKPTGIITGQPRPANPEDANYSPDDNNPAAGEAIDF